MMAAFHLMAAFRSIRPGGILGTLLKDLRDDNCVGLIAGMLPVATALLLVKGKEESVMQRLQGRAPWTQAYIRAELDGHRGVRQQASRNRPVWNRPVCGEWDPTLLSGV